MNALALISIAAIQIPTYDNRHLTNRIEDFPLWMSDNNLRLKCYFQAIRSTQPADEEPLDWFLFVAAQHTDEQMRARCEREIA